MSDDMRIREWDNAQWSRQLGSDIREKIETDSLQHDWGEWSLDEQGTYRNEKNSVEVTEQGDIFGQHKHLKSFLKNENLSGTRQFNETDLELTVESHHLIPKVVLEDIGINPDDGVAVALPVDQHKAYEDIWKTEKHPKFDDVEDLEIHYTDTYRELEVSDWNRKITQFVQENRSEIEKGLQEMNSHVETEPDVEASSKPISPIDSNQLESETSSDMIDDDPENVKS